jgi:hypothetical protein
MLSLVWKQVTRSTSPAASTCDRRPLRSSVCLRFWIGSFTLKCLLWERVGDIGCRVDSVQCRLFGAGIEDRVKSAKSWRMMVDHGWKLIRRLEMTLSAPTWPNKGCLEVSGVGDVTRYVVKQPRRTHLIDSWTVGVGSCEDATVGCLS